MNDQHDRPPLFKISWKTRSIDNPRAWEEIPASYARRRLTMDEAIAITNGLLIIKGAYQVLMKAGDTLFLYTTEATL